MDDQIDDADRASAGQPEHAGPIGQHPPMTQPQQTPQQGYQAGYSADQPAYQTTGPGQPVDLSAQPSQPYHQPYQSYLPLQADQAYQQVPPTQANAQFPQQAPTAAAYQNPVYPVYPVYPTQLQGPSYPYQPYPSGQYPYSPQPVPPYQQIPPYQPAPPYQQMPPSPYSPQPFVQAQQPAWIPQRVLTYAQQVRRAVDREARLVLFYCVVMTAIALVASMTIIAILTLKGMPTTEIYSDALQNRMSGVVSLVALVGCAVYLGFRRPHDPLWKGLPHELRLEITGHGQRAHRTMTPVVFLVAIMLILGASSVYTFILEPALDWVSGLFGAKPDTAMDSIDASMGTLAMVLYAGFFGPIMEELLFRGLVMPALAKYGKVFSIVTSAVLFGFFHTDLLQGAYAILVGLVLGYIATEYGLVWSIALHITNNFVFSDLLSRLLAVMPQDAQNVVGYGFTIAVGVGSLLYLILRFSRIRDYMKAHRSPQGTVAACWSSPWFLVFLVLSFLVACATGFTSV
ncbi:MAG: CPBP family glutamic-type intramembrane protease [Bifidobacterium thermacidophilum]|jgi:membrane protease YdiL (CAAX protease family)|nr:CPBP family glutamic-type intramembrane protease [Bifidobacterium thermacidophilum]